MIYVKFHRAGLSMVVAICDRDLIGKTFSEGKMRLDVKESFYKGELMSKKEIKKILKTADNLNIVGKEAIKLALNENLIKKEHIITIKGVPHAQIYSF